MVVKVIGMHRDSGEPMTRVYEVETEREAIDKAYAENMVIEDTERLPDPKVVEAQMIERQRRQEAKAQAQAAQHEQKRRRLLSAQQFRMQQAAEGRHVQWVRLTGMSELSMILVIAVGVFIGMSAFGCCGGFLGLGFFASALDAASGG